jgi:DNA-directed RNA polymerase specialized sigma24 family protein
MSDSDAIVKYQSAAQYLRILDKLGPPAVPLSFPPDKADQKALERSRRIHERSREQALQVMGQAERTVRALPRPEWRDAFELIYFHGLTVEETAYSMSYSERAVYRFLRMAFDYIDAGKETGPGRP